MAIDTAPSMDSVFYEVHGNVAVVTLDRPERMNSLGGTMKADLARAFFDLARKHETVRAVLLTGRGDRAFCAGADIKEQASRSASASEFLQAQKLTHELFRDIEEFEKPVVAAINGVAIGGGLELALCCDLRLASVTARFGLPELGLGVIPAAGGTQRLPRLIGSGRAKEMIMTSEIVGAAVAIQYGLVSRVYEPAALMDEALRLTQSLAERPPLAMRLVKRAINRGLQVDLDSGLEYERTAAAIVFDSSDRREGMQAFVEKRKPVFTGR